MLLCKIDQIAYGDALDLQHRLLQCHQEGKIGDVFLVLEHPPVITMGTRAKNTNILVPDALLRQMGIEVFEIERGGDVTYHGPGQIVGYPILDLRNYGRDIHKFVERIEQITIDYLWQDYRIKASLDPAYTGVFVDRDKITAIGFAVRRWFTFHGFALNINTNLDHFNLITPCGITDRGVTSVQKLTGQTVDMNRAKERICEIFCDLFSAEPEYISLEELVKLC